MDRDGGILMGAKTDHRNVRANSKPLLKDRGSYANVLETLVNFTLNVFNANQLFTGNVFLVSSLIGLELI